MRCFQTRSVCVLPSCETQVPNPYQRFGEILVLFILLLLIPVAERSKAWVCSCLLGVIVHMNSAGVMVVLSLVSVVSLTE